MPIRVHLSPRWMLHPSPSAVDGASIEGKGDLREGLFDPLRVKVPCYLIPSASRLWPSSMLAMTGSSGAVVEIPRS